MRSSLLAAGLLATALALTACKSDPPLPPGGENPVLGDAALAETTVGVSYFATVNVSGGTGPYTFTAQGLPPGLFMAGNGTLSGTATTAGDYQVQVSVSDANGKQASKALALKVYAGLSFKQSALPQATAESPYSATLELEGGKAPLTLRVAQGDLPPGVSFNAGSRQLAGTFSSSGTLALTFEASDVHGAKATQSYTVSVAGPLRLTATLPAGNVGQPYSQALATTGGRSPLTLSLESGALPPGLTLSNGVISGTPTTSGTFTLGIKVTDANGASITANVTLDIFSGLPPQLPAAVLPNGVVGKDYSELLLGSDGAPPYSFTISSGALPAGLALSAAGVISGTPTAADTQSFLVTLTDTRGQKAQRSFTLTVFPLLVVQTTALAEGYQGQFYNQTLIASGGKTPYRWESQGTLPTGLNLTTAGILSGTPTVAGSYGLTFSLTDGSGQLATGAFQLTLYTLPAITTAALADGAVGVAYNQRLRASGGKAPYTFAITGGVLPPGLQLTGDTINGTPTTAVASNITVQVTDANGKTASADLDLRIFNGLTITTGVLDDSYVGRSYAMTLTAVGGDTSKPYAWTNIGPLPAGLSLSTAGVITGTATTADTVRFTARVTDNSAASVTRVFDLRVLTPPSVSTASLPEAYAGAAYSATLNGADGLPPYQWRVSAGTLPAGLTLSTTGVLSGTPTVAGTSSFTVELTDANGVKGTRALSLTVSTLTITNTAMDDGYAGQPYSYTLAATGGPAPFTWNLTGLPGGLSYDTATGVVSGTPAASGTTTVTARVTDALNRSFTRNLTLTVYGLPQITTTALAEGAVNVAYTQVLDATNGKPPYSWSVTGTLHAGLTFSQNAGVWAIRGTPTESGTRTLSFLVTDANGKTASRSLDLLIVAPLVLATTALPDAYEGKAYDQSLAATGGKPGYTFDRPAGALPGGLSLSPAGRISGTVAAGATTSGFTARVTDTANVQATRDLTIAVYQTPTITTASYPDGYISASYSGDTTATGGKAPLAWSLATGTLPTGVTLDALTGRLSGTPTQAGSFSFTLKVRDANGEESTRPLQVAIYALPTVASTSPLPGAYVGLQYSNVLTATGGKAPLTFSLAGGSPPTGLLLATDGTLAGVVSATVAHGTLSTFTVQVTDVNGKTASKSLDLTSYKPPEILSTSLTTATEGVNYRRSEASAEKLDAQYGQPGLTFAATGLPAGLSLIASTGDLGGTPAQGSAGSYTVNFTVTDAGGKSASKTLPLTVVAPQPSNYGGVVGLAPGGSTITDTLTVFTVTGRRPLAGVGVRVRKNGVEYSPAKEALTTAAGKVVFTGLGLNGTTDTVDITANGKELVNTTLAGVNASLVTLSMASTPVPGPRALSASAYDPTSRRFLITSGHDSSTSNSLFYTSCLNDTVELTDVAQKTFITRVPGGLTTSPGPRYEAGMAIAGSTAVLFGGYNCLDTDPLGDTWEYNLSTNAWTQISVTNGPAPRRGAALVREPSGNSVLLVGGYRAPSYSNEVWRYTPSTDTWTPLAAAPFSRSWMAATTNTGTGEIWFCGGRGPSGYTAECQSFNPTTQVWTVRPSLPTARSDFAMAFNPFTGNLHAFGGRDGALTLQGGLLVLPPGASSWTELTPPGPVPPSRYGHVMYFDLTRQELVLSLGTTRDPVTNRTFRLGDMWTYDGNGWTERGPTTPSLPSYTVSGELFNGPIFGYAQIQLATPSGFSTSTAVNLDDTGHAAYAISGVPPGEAAFMTVIGYNLNLAYPDILWSYTDRELTPLLGNTVANFNLPTGPAVLLRTTGQFLLPPSWHGQTDTITFADAYLDVPGFPYVFNGATDSNLPSGQFDMAYLPTAAPKAQRLLGYTSSQLGCEDYGFYGLATPGNQDLTASGFATGVTPGQPECTPAGSRALTQARQRAFFYSPERAAVADLDGDTLQDVVIPSLLTSWVSILWGNASMLQAFSADDCCDVDSAHSVAIGDFNKDGRPDLALTEWYSGQVKIKMARNDMPRAFGPSTAYTVGTNPSGIATADVDNDGQLDLLVANQGSNNVMFLKGQPGGSFGAPVTITLAGTSPTTVLVTNVDGDSKPDLVVLVSQGVSLALDGTAQGPFGNSTLLVPGAQPSAVAVGQLNNDSWPDIAVSNAGSNSISLFFGVGSGGFGSPSTLNSVGTAPSDLIIADLNGDTHLDLAVTSPTDNAITVLQGASNGSFSVYARVPVSAPRGLVALDFNGDSLKDVVALSPTINSTYILPGHKPLPSSPGSSFSFVAPAKAGFMWSMHRINGQRRYWDYYAPLQAGPVSYSLPLASTLAPSAAPVAPAAGKVELNWTPYVHKWEPDSAHPFNPRQFSFARLGKDADTQPGASHYLWP